MATVIKMPQLGESVAEGTIGRWLKQPGDRVERDEPLVEIQTDKVNAEVPSPVAGFLQQILLPEGTTAAVKTDMAVIGDEPVGSAPPPEAAPTAQGPEGTTTQRTFSYDKNLTGGVVGQRDGETPPPEPAPAPSPAAAPSPAPESGAKRFYTPVVLRMAEEHNIDLSQIQGSGTLGRVTRKDVERAIAAGTTSAPARGEPVEPRAGQLPTTTPSAEPARRPAPAPGEHAEPVRRQAPARGEPVEPGAGQTPDEERALSPMRRAIADHMARARADIPDAWSLVEIDVTRLVRYRASALPDFQAREGFELTYLPFFIKAVLAGLRAVPELNATWQGDHITVHNQYHLGIAVSLDNGLIVPVLRDADRLSIAGLASALRTVVQKARGGKLTLDDLQGATFTVNNPGSLGSIMSQPIVPVGQAGIVTMESIVKRPIVTGDDAIAVRSMMNSCLSFDHRILDGAQALHFLRTVRQQLETVDYPLY
jgi:2-oxoisovalerate dehydrogenase E2 component (dihydrolipoyl transacylase)